MEFMRAGGYAMWVVLLFGGITMTMAVMSGTREGNQA